MDAPFSSQGRQKKAAEDGIRYVKNQWSQMLFGRSSKKPRLSPSSDKYDIHINIPYDSPVQVSSDMQPSSAKARPVCLYLYIYSWYCFPLPSACVSTFVWQSSGYISLAAATGYLSLLFGLQLPSTFALCGEVYATGTMYARNICSSTLQTAREAGITTLLVGHSQVSESRGMQASPPIMSAVVVV